MCLSDCNAEDSNISDEVKAASRLANWRQCINAAAGSYRRRRAERVLSKFSGGRRQFPLVGRVSITA